MESFREIAIINKMLEDKSLPKSIIEKLRNKKEILEKNKTINK